MTIGYLTTDDPLYLPAFFREVLSHRTGDSATVYVVPPLYRKQTPLMAATRYWRTFGTISTLHLSARVVAAKVRGVSIMSVCERAGVTCEAIRDVNAGSFLSHLRERGTELLVSVSCPQVFRRPLIDLPPKGILNIHGALLPQYRGVMPSFWMMANGEREAGVSIYFVNEAIDAGDLCGQRRFAIEPEESLHTFLTRSKAMAAELLIEVLDRVQNGTVERHPLNLAEGSYYSWPTREAVASFRGRGRKLW